MPAAAAFPGSGRRSQGIPQNYNEYIEEYLSPSAARTADVGHMRTVGQGFGHHDNQARHHDNQARHHDNQAAPAYYQPHGEPHDNSFYQTMNQTSFTTHQQHPYAQPFATTDMAAAQLGFTRIGGPPLLPLGYREQMGVGTESYVTPYGTLAVADMRADDRLNVELQHHVPLLRVVQNKIVRHQRPGLLSWLNCCGLLDAPGGLFGFMNCNGLCDHEATVDLTPKHGQQNYYY